MMQDERVDVNKQDEDGHTPFYVGCSWPHTSCKYMMQDENMLINQITNNCHTQIRKIKKEISYICNLYALKRLEQLPHPNSKKYNKNIIIY